MQQNLANNELSGGLSSLPPNLKLLNLSANALDGLLPTRLPVSLAVLDLSLNKLTGEGGRGARYEGVTECALQHSGVCMVPIAFRRLMGRPLSD